MKTDLPVDPNCPSTKRHRSLNAHRSDGCTCTGESWDRYEAYRERQRQLRGTRDRTKDREYDARRRREQMTRRDFTVAGTFVATDLDRQLRDTVGLACRRVDPKWFEIDGDDRLRAVRQQIDVAREVCLRCPAMQLCREAALQHHEPWTFQGGMSPREQADERARRRKRKPVPAPALEAPDPNVVQAFIAERPLSWAQLNEADKAFLVGEARRRGFTCNSVALATKGSFRAVRSYWEAAA